MHARAEPELMEREVAAPDINALPALLRAEIDGAVATARAFPRSTTEFLREVTSLVTLDEETAEACHYALPRKDKDGKRILIEGPSARFAELIQYSWGNNRGGGRVISDEGGFVTAQGTFHDLEKNVQVVMEVKRRITTSTGKRFGDDMIGVTGNAAASIAHRNAVLKAIPKAIWNAAYQRAKAVAVGDMETLGAKREKALAWFAKCGVSPEQVYAKLDIVGLDDLGLEQYAVLLGIKTAIKEGARPEEVFAEEKPESAVKAATNVADMSQVAEKLAARKPKAEKPPADMDPATGEVPAPDHKKVLAALHLASNLTELEEAASAIGGLPDGDGKNEAHALYIKRLEAFNA